MGGKIRRKEKEKGSEKCTGVILSNELHEVYRLVMLSNELYQKQNNVKKGMKKLHM